MNENYDKLKVLLNQYSNGTITENEAHELFGLLNNNPENDIEPLLTEGLEDAEPQPDCNHQAQGSGPVSGLLLIFNLKTIQKVIYLSTIH